MGSWKEWAQYVALSLLIFVGCPFLAILTAQRLFGHAIILGPVLFFAPFAALKILSHVRRSRWRRDFEWWVPDPEAAAIVAPFAKEAGVKEVKVARVKSHYPHSWFWADQKWIVLEDDKWTPAPADVRRMIAAGSVAQFVSGYQTYWRVQVLIATYIYLGGVISTQNLWFVVPFQLICLVSPALYGRRWIRSYTQTTDEVALKLLGSAHWARELVEITTRPEPYGFLTSKAERLAHLRTVAGSLGIPWEAAPSSD